MPIGAPGELWVGGDGGGRGISTIPSARPKSVVPDPFGGDVMLACTDGDLARYRPTAHRVLGRTTIRSKCARSVSSSARSNRDKSHAACRCVWFARDEGTVRARVVAYSWKQSHDGKDLREFLRRATGLQVPGHSSESHRSALAERKVDRRALPAPSGHNTFRSVCATAPRRDSPRRHLDSSLGLNGSA